MLVKGVIYMYTSPNGKSYIGQTIREEQRRKLWRSSRYHYAGDKIDRARKKYGNDSFKYDILFEKEFSTDEIATIWLNVAEQYYIKLYDTVNKGYNCEIGGGGFANHKGAINHHHGGYKLSEETKRRIGEGAKAWQNTPEGKAKMAAARKGIKRKKGYRIEKKFKPVIQLTLDGEFIQEYSSIQDAGIAIGGLNSKCKINIGNVCKGKRDSAEGYKWMYSDDYYNFFLHPETADIPQRVKRAIDCIANRHTPKEKKKYPHKPRPKKDGPKINRFAQQIGQYNLDYELVKVWRCATEAANSLGIWQTNISRAARTLGVYMGYYWRKYNGQQVCSPKPKKKIIRPKAWKKVVQMDMNGNILNVYDNIRKACDAVGANNKSLMSRCLNQKVDRAYGYKWKFYDCV